MLQKKILEKVKKRVVKSFPELKDVKPRVKTIKVPPQQRVYTKLKAGMARTEHKHIQVHFKKRFKTADGFSITKIVKVSVTEKGEVLKITTSR